MNPFKRILAESDARTANADVRAAGEQRRFSIESQIRDIETGKTVFEDDPECWAGEEMNYENLKHKLNGLQNEYEEFRSKDIMEELERDPYYMSKREKLNKLSLKIEELQDKLDDLEASPSIMMGDTTIEIDGIEVDVHKYVKTLNASIEKLENSKEKIAKELYSLKKDKEYRHENKLKSLDAEIESVRFRLGSLKNTCRKTADQKRMEALKELNLELNMRSIQYNNWHASEASKARPIIEGLFGLGTVCAGGYLYSKMHKQQLEAGEIVEAKSTRGSALRNLIRW